jgi:undecaprenyl-diphosphatase
MAANAFYFRPRPYVAFPQVLAQVDRLFYQPTVSSFPSYPAALTFAFAFGIWLENRTVGAVLFILAVLMSLARIYVGVHYPSDIVAGAAVGILVTYLVFSLLKTGVRPLVDYIISLLERIYMA